MHRSGRFQLEKLCTFYDREDCEQGLRGKVRTQTYPWLSMFRPRWTSYSQAHSRVHNTRTGL